MERRERDEETSDSSTDIFDNRSSTTVRVEVERISTVKVKRYGRFPILEWTLSLRSSEPARSSNPLLNLLKISSWKNS